MDISILIYIISGVVVLLAILIAIIEHRLKKLFAGGKVDNLEDSLANINNKIKELKEIQIQIDKHLMSVDDRLNKSVRKVQTIRFNPFGTDGGNQSFAMALLNDEGNGVVMSSLYARDRMSIFAKPIVSGKSEFELSEEEKEVLNKAL